MLMGIPAILQPDLLKTLMEMGHGDEIVIADGNFPAASCAARLIRSDGNGVCELLRAIVRFFPLDTFVPLPVALMAVVPGDDYVPAIQAEFRQIIAQAANPPSAFEYLGREAFYQRAKAAYAVVATSETARYANIILKKGIVGE